MASWLVFAPATNCAAAPSGTGPLAGEWTSTDTADGSHQTLEVTGSGNRVYSMAYVDDWATACAGNPARLSGPGYVDGDGVHMVAALVCLPGGNHLRQRLTIAFQHDTQNDTLTDKFGIVWNRVS